MLFFGRKKKNEEEEELDEKLPPKRKIRDLNSSNRRKRAEPIKPWGKRERYLVLFVFGTMAITSAALAAYARAWKLPGLPRISLPQISFDKTYEFEKLETTPTPQQETNFSEIKNKISQITSEYSGVYSVYFQDLNTKESFTVEGDTVMQAASLIKLPVLAALYNEEQKGNLDLDSLYILKESDKTSGSGSLSAKNAGTKITYRQLIELMGQQSDNTAFTIALNTLGDKTRTYIDEFGMRDTSVEENTTTAYDIGLFFQKLMEGRLIPTESREELLDYLTKTIYEDWLPANVPEGVRVAHKYGREIHVINDAGVVFASKPFILVVMSRGIVESEAAIAIPQIIKEIYNFQTL